MAISYVGDALSDAAAGDLVLAVAVYTGDALSTPAGWQALFPAPTSNFQLQVFMVPSWSTSLSDAPSFGTSSVGYSVLSGAFFDSGARSTQVNVSPATSVSTSSDWVVAFEYVDDASSTTAPSGMTLRGSIYVNSHDSPTVSLVQADTDGSSVAIGTTGQYQWGGSEGLSPGGVTIALMGAVTPQTPTLVSPSTGSYAEMADEPTFTATYNNIDGSTCGAYQFRRKVSGATSYTYWNATSAAFQSTAIWNPGTMNVTFPAGSWSDGTTWNWSFNSESSYESSLTSGFAGDFTVIGQVAPTLTVTAPTGTQTTATPAITWTPAPASGSTLIAYRVVTYLTSTTTASGFAAGQSTGLLDDSGVTPGSATSYTPGQLPNESDLTSYVQVTETGNETSLWESTAYSTNYDAPATPVIDAQAAVDADGIPCIALTITGLTVGALLTVTYTDAENTTAVPVRFANGITIPSGGGDVDTITTTTTTTTGTDGDFDTATTWDAGTAFDDQGGAETTTTTTTTETGTIGFTVNDYEAIPLVPRSYVATQTTSPTEANGYVTLPSDSSVTATATLTVTTWWLIEPLNPSTGSLPLSVQDNPVNRYGNLATHYPVSAPGAPAVTYPVVVSSGVAGQDGQIVVQTTTQAAFENIEAVLELATVKWLMSPYGWGIYCRVGTTNPVSGMSGQVQQTAITPSPSTSPNRMVTIQYTEQAMP